MRSLVVAAIMVVAGLCFAFTALAGSAVSKADSTLSVVLAQPDTSTTTLPVYIYGLCYEAPHILVWQDAKLWCHGVQVYPRVRPASKAPSASACGRFALDVRADSVAQATGQDPRSRKTLEAMRAVYAASPLVENAWFDEQGQLMVKYWSMNFPLGVRSERGPKPGNNNIDPYQEALDTYQDIQKAWRFGRIMVIGATYTQIVSDIEKAKQQIAEARAGQTDVAGPLCKEALDDIVGKERQQ